MRNFQRVGCFIENAEPNNNEQSVFKGNPIRKESDIYFSYVGIVSLLILSLMSVQGTGREQSIKVCISWEETK